MLSREDVGNDYKKRPNGCMSDNDCRYSAIVTPNTGENTDLKILNEPNQYVLSYPNLCIFGIHFVDSEDDKLTGKEMIHLKCPGPYPIRSKENEFCRVKGDNNDIFCDKDLVCINNVCQDYRLVIYS